MFTVFFVARKGIFMSKEVYMCRPCAENLKKQGVVKIGCSVIEKQTCEVCQRRRFVYRCTYIDKKQS